MHEPAMTMKALRWLLTRSPHAQWCGVAITTLVVAVFVDARQKRQGYARQK